MSALQPDFFPQGINQYVPNMQYSDNIDLREGTQFSLGSPAAFDADALDTDIDADAAAATETTQNWTSDVPFGRTLVMQASGDPGGATVIDVYGWDYLGQHMTERFTLANGGTLITYGKKAFYRVYKTVNVTAAVNAVTATLGIGFSVGLPYKGVVESAKEGGVWQSVYNKPFWLDPAVFNAVDAAAGSSRFLPSPCAGSVKTLKGYHNVAGSTNDPVITVELGGTAITGLTITLDVSGTAGTVVTDTPTTPGYNANNRVRKDDRVEIVGAAAASADEYIVMIEIDPTQSVHADATDPATASTGDTRGTYEPQETPDGATEIIVNMLLDPSSNASENGGLHGIAQV